MVQNMLHLFAVATAFAFCLVSFGLIAAQLHGARHLIADALQGRVAPLAVQPWPGRVRLVSRSRVPSFRPAPLRSARV